MKIPKDDAMLIDIQYVKANKRKGHKDYLYIIWKEISTGQKHLSIVEEPLMEIYFEKPEFRDHEYNINYQHIENLDKVVIKYRDIIYAIAEDMGDEGKRRLNNYFTTGNYQGLKEFLMYPYVFGADYDIRAWYRHQWLLSFDNDKSKPITKGYADIEVDGLESVGLPTPVFNPIDLVTVIDTQTKESYTFALIGVECQEKDMTNMNEKEKAKELERRALYKKRLEQQEHWSTHIDELEEEAKKMFAENYPGFHFNFYFYKDERKMLVHLFQLINTLKLDFIGFWNISFDIPYIIERLQVLGLDPAEVMCPKDFPVKECYFKKDEHNFDIKNKSDFFHITSYTVFYDQMITYAAIRKSSSELRSYKLTYIAEHEISDSKLNYEEDGNIKTVSYNNYLRYVLYNIKDVLLQVGIENRTSDIETYYITSYKNMTPYDSEFKQTIKLRNIQYRSFYSQSLIPGENVNALYNKGKDDVQYEDDEGNIVLDIPIDSDKKSKFEGALVGNPLLIDNFGSEMYGHKTNSIFEYSIDMDMSAFYPSTIRVMNIDGSTLIFKMIIDPEQYDVRGGDIPFNGITDVQMVETNGDSFKDDIGKEVFDNLQTKNYLFSGNKWMNLPSVDDIYKICKKKLK